jgi:hypothetical protein
MLATLSEILAEYHTLTPEEIKQWTDAAVIAIAILLPLSMFALCPWAKFLRTNFHRFYAQRPGMCRPPLKKLPAIRTPPVSTMSKFLSKLNVWLEGKTIWRDVVPPMKDGQLVYISKGTTPAPISRYHSCHTYTGEYLSWESPHPSVFWTTEELGKGPARYYYKWIGIDQYGVTTPLITSSIIVPP